MTDLEINENAPPAQPAATARLVVNQTREWIITYWYESAGKSGFGNIQMSTENPVWTLTALHIGQALRAAKERSAQQGNEYINLAFTGVTPCIEAAVEAPAPAPKGAKKKSSKKGSTKKKPASKAKKKSSKKKSGKK